MAVSCVVAVCWLSQVLLTITKKNIYFWSVAAALMVWMIGGTWARTVKQNGTSVKPLNTVDSLLHIHKTTSMLLTCILSVTYAEGVRSSRKTKEVCQMEAPWTAPLGVSSRQLVPNHLPVVYRCRAISESARHKTYHPQREIHFK